MRKAFDPIVAIRHASIINDTLSPAQETYLRCLYGLPLDDRQLEIYARATGRTDYSPREFRESTCIAGRRSGKSSKLAANIATYEAAFRNHKLAPGEKGWVIVLASTRRQAGVCFDYVRARIENSPTLRKMLAGEPREDELDLTNGISIGVWANSYRSIRGLSIIACIADEISFWHDDTTNANPASEVLRAVRPGMANFKSAKLVKITSPFAKQGITWEDWRDRAKHPEMLVWKLGTREMNPSLDRAFLDEEEKRDGDSFLREYGAEFYESASAFLSAEAVEAAVIRGRYEFPPQEGVFYCAALDAAFRGDQFAFAVAHRAGEKVVQDLTRSWRGSKSNPVSLAAVLAEITDALGRYGVAKIHGDQFCAEPIRQALAQKGVTFVQTTTLGARASAIWATLRTLFASGKFELLEDEQTTQELKRLELIVTSGGNQRVEASGGGHDDRAVALAVAAHQAVARPVREPWAEALVFTSAELSSTDSGPEKWWHRLS